MSKKDESLIIFDFDGVIRSASWEGLFEAYIAVISSLENDYRKFFPTLQEFKKWWNPDWIINNKILGITNYKTAGKIFYKHYEPYVALFPWAAATLKQLSQKYILAIVSNSSEIIVVKSLGETAKYFSLILGAEHVKKLKPNPEGVNFVLAKLKFPAYKAITIGDTKEDLMAGISAGTKIGAISWGLGELDDLMKLNPDYCFKKPNDLLSLL